jgi:hypothetical protein
MDCRNLSVNSRRGAVPMELIIAALVILVIIILMTPVQRALREESEENRCLQARREIADAIKKHRALSSTYSYPKDLPALRVHLPQIPECPRHGRIRWRLSHYSDRTPEGRAAPLGRLVVLCSEDRHRPYYAPSDE